MHSRIFKFAFVLTLLASTQALWADEERTNEPVVSSSWDGTCYAKSVPKSEFGDDGTTTIYKVGGTSDVASDSFNWYSRSVYVLCDIWEGGRGWTAVVRVFKMSSGFEADKETPAIEFYVSGKLVKHYSTLEIAGKPENVFSSASHYTPFRTILGFRANGSGQFEFVTILADGKELRFDWKTGRTRAP